MVKAVSTADLSNAWDEYFNDGLTTQEIINTCISYFNSVNDLDNFFDIVESCVARLGGFWEGSAHATLLANGMFDKYFLPLGNSRELFNAYASNENRDIPWWLSTFGTFRHECVELMCGGDVDDLLDFLDHYSREGETVPYDRFFNISGFDTMVCDKVTVIFSKRGSKLAKDEEYSAIYYYVFAMRDYWPLMVDLRYLIVSYGRLDEYMNFANEMGEEDANTVPVEFYDGLPPEMQLGVVI